MDTERRRRPTDNGAAYVRLMGKVTARTSGLLLKAIDGLARDNVNRVNLMISSPGGAVFYGLSLYNFLRGTALEVHTYNFGIVGSAGLLLYCAGSRRYATPLSRFLFHGTEVVLQSQTRLDERALAEQLREIQLDNYRIVRPVAAAVGKPEGDVLRLFAARTAMSAQEAMEFGLVHETATELLPAGARLLVVSEGPEASHQPNLAPPLPSEPNSRQS